jgi:hypothetical protein
MNWFVSEPVSAEGVLQAGLPFLEFLCLLVGIIAVLMLLIASLHTILGEAKQRVARIPSSVLKGKNCPGEMHADVAGAVES